MEVEVKETLGNVTTQPASTFADSRSTILTNVDKLCDKIHYRFDHGETAAFSTEERRVTRNLTTK